MKKYKVNIVWEAQIEMKLDENDPMEEYYMDYSWDEIYFAMQKSGIHEDVSMEEIND